MLRPLLLPLLILLASGCHSSCGSCGDGECTTETSKVPAEPVETSPAVAWQSLVRGVSSGVREPRRIVARSAEDWAAFWVTHAADRIPAESVPMVDFTKDMVVGIVLGERPTAGYEVEIVSVAREGDRLVVRTREVRPAPDSVQAQVITVPFALATISRFGGEVAFAGE